MLVMHVVEHCACVCLLPVRAKAKIRGNKYGATRSAGDYRRKVQLKFFDVALDLLKRHSGIVWGPGWFRGIAPRRGREEVGEPCGRTRPKPHALAMPGATQLTVKSP